MILGSWHVQIIHDQVKGSQVKLNWYFELWSAYQNQEHVKRRYLLSRMQIKISEVQQQLGTDRNLGIFSPCVIKCWESGGCKGEQPPPASVSALLPLAAETCPWPEEAV